MAYLYAWIEQNRYKFNPHPFSKKFFEGEREGKLLYTKVSPRISFFTYPISSTSDTTIGAPSVRARVRR